MADWKETTLEELIDVKHGYAFKGEYFSDVPNGNVVLTPGNFEIGGGFKHAKSKCYTSPIPSEYILKGGDVVVTMTDLSKGGDTLGYSAMIPKDASNKYLHNQRIGLVQLKSNKADLNFIYWLMRWRDYQLFIVNTATGSTVRHTSPKKIQSFSFLLPSLEEQKEITGILSSLDDKIELLREENKTLEVTAQAIFKEWFANFNFPNIEGKPYKSSGGKMISFELGEIPERWRVGKLGEEVKIVMGQSPSGESYNENGEGVVFYQGRAEFTERFPQVRLYTTEPKRMAERFDVLVSVRAPVGDINVASEACCIGRGLAAVRSKYKSYVLYKIKSLKDSFDKFEAEGTVFGSINKESFSNIEVLIPTIEVMEGFDVFARSIDEKIFNNYSSIQTLSTLRDTLLPKLMSGDVRII